MSIASLLKLRAHNLEFSLAIRPHASSKPDHDLPTEIIVTLSGSDASGQPHETRHAVTHRQGQMPLTSLGVVLLLERLTGLDGVPSTPPGLYFPYQRVDSATYHARLRAIGGEVLSLPTEHSFVQDNTPSR